MVGTASNLAINGGVPVCKEPWPTWPPVNPKIRKSVIDALESGRWAISGPKVDRPPIQRDFEDAWARYCEVRFAVAVSSGSSALVLALEALGVGPGDEVIVPVWTWVACATSVLRVGAKPVFADVSSDNFCISASGIEPLITNRTKAIIVVHQHQSVADMYPIIALARDRKLYVVEDAAQAHGALYDGQRVGSFGDIAAFSFQQTKVITSGEGGMVVTNDEGLAERVFELHVDGRRASKHTKRTGLELEVGTGPMGANHAMTEFQAAILLAQLPELDRNLEESASNATFLDERLALCALLRCIRHPQLMDRRTVFRYIVSFDPEVVARVKIDKLAKALGAETGINWASCDPPIHQSPLYRPSTKPRFQSIIQDNQVFSRYPVTDDYSARSVTCHHSVFLADRARISSIVEAFGKVIDHLHALE